MHISPMDSMQTADPDGTVDSAATAAIGIQVPHASLLPAPVMVLITKDTAPALSVIIITLALSATIIAPALSAATVVLAHTSVTKPQTTAPTTVLPITVSHLTRITALIMVLFMAPIMALPLAEAAAPV